VKSNYYIHLACADLCQLFPACAKSKFGLVVSVSSEVVTVSHCLFLGYDLYFFLLSLNFIAIFFLVDAIFGTFTSYMFIKKKCVSDFRISIH